MGRQPGGIKSVSKRKKITPRIAAFFLRAFKKFYQMRLPLNTNARPLGNFSNEASAIDSRNP